ncbi:ROK family transcriptional regulator [Streptomyces tsukubensis]|uniref:ROK family protein n=1 Tax=Streptomyces tsukubensis TaxID=83656 RepID=A0A1V4A0H7_9ACTN|nr:ROK family transcriptional regulator [Streptomyces tsukubensis]OON72413.1 ROK family protein [Streptomyces tsukubensis]QFR96941.1 ROK family protein [Streptomyces tsukubensis]
MSGADGPVTAALPDTQQGMRRRNLSRVMHTVAAHGPLSRAAVATRIGLTRAAVSTLVDELIRSGLLDELGPERPGRVGRPGSALAVSARGPAGLGAEIGVDQLTVCAVDLHGEVRARAVRRTDNRGRPPGPVLGELGALVGQVAEETRHQGLWPAGLAVAVPGLVAREGHLVERAPNLGWHGADLGGLLPGELPVTIDNEANFGALAELWTGAGHHEDFIHVSAAIGIGAAVILDGRLLRGTHGFAGELGHVPVRPEGPVCPCGGRGCLEQYAGQEAVLRAAGLDPGEDRVGLLAGRAAEGDRAVLRALRGAGSALGIALSGAVNLLDPQGVVLGGALAGLAPWLLPALERELGRRTATATRPVTVSELGPEGPLLGAAHSVVRAVLDDPATAVPAQG